MIKFQWNKQKADANKKKHGVSFDEAATVFHDLNGRILSDSDHSTGEDRFILLGVSIKLRMIVVAHTYREDHEEIRIISARKATRQEKSQYEGLKS